MPMTTYFQVNLINTWLHEEIDLGYYSKINDIFAKSWKKSKKALKKPSWTLYVFISMYLSIYLWTYLYNILKDSNETGKTESGGWERDFGSKKLHY